MLLVVDVGNTNTVLGVFKGADLLAHWRIETRKARTSDEYAATLHTLFQLAGLPWGQVTAGPAAKEAFCHRASRRVFVCGPAPARQLP